jgi:hypothetical protein
LLGEKILTCIHDEFRPYLEVTIMTVGIGALSTLGQIKELQQVANEVNAACENLGLPPAIEIDLSIPKVETNKDYRFEGFGFVLGLPPKISFYVHYKPESEEHVEVGRFLMPLGISEFFQE